jgi:hypothetical protein
MPDVRRLSGMVIVSNAVRLRRACETVVLQVVPMQLQPLGKVAEAAELPNVYCIGLGVATHLFRCRLESECIFPFR